MLEMKGERIHHKLEERRQKREEGESKKQIKGFPTNPCIQSPVLMSMIKLFLGHAVIQERSLFLSLQVEEEDAHLVLPCFGKIDPSIHESQRQLAFFGCKG